MSVKKYKDRVEKTENDKLYEKARQLLESKFPEPNNPDTIIIKEIGDMFGQMANYLISEIGAENIKIIDAVCNRFIQDHVYANAPDRWQ